MDFKLCVAKFFRQLFSFYIEVSLIFHLNFNSFNLESKIFSYLTINSYSKGFCIYIFQNFDHIKVMRKIFSISLGCRESKSLKTTDLFCWLETISKLENIYPFLFWKEPVEILTWIFKQDQYYITNQIAYLLNYNLVT